MRDSRTTQTDNTATGRRESPEPGLVVVFVQSAPASIVIPLVDGQIVVGRSLLAEHGFDDARMSRQHVCVSSRASGWEFRDLDSRNGSFVDGVRLTDVHEAAAPRVLRAGDTLFLPVVDVRAFAARSIEIANGVVRGPTLRRVFDQISRTSSSSVLHIHGETGAGKELAARHFHEHGPRARGPFVAVNCAAIPASVAERLLFGVRRGTYTGADADADGFIQAADGGTIFLDEIADLDLMIQGKLLRTLESGEVLPLGAAKARRVDVALVSATAAELEECVAKKTFRQDLYFRVARPAVRIPPLRDRLEEIPWLAGEVVRSFEGSPSVQLHVSLVEAALCRAWPGNVRELLAEARVAVRAARGEGSATVRAGHLAEGAGAQFEAAPAARPTEEDEARSRERAQLVEALHRERGNVAAAARRLGLHRTQLRRMLVRHAIDPHAIDRVLG